MLHLSSTCRIWCPHARFRGFGHQIQAFLEELFLGALFRPPLCALCTEWPFLCTLSFYKGCMPLLWTVLRFCASHAQPWILCSQKGLYFWSPDRGCTLILEYTLKVLFLDLFLRALFTSCSYTAVYAPFACLEGYMPCLSLSAHHVVHHVFLPNMCSFYALFFVLFFVSFDLLDFDNFLRGTP